MTPKNYTHIVARDLSWLEFNERVLQEAQDELNPLIERLRFLGIFSSNMDEFFRVRYASIKRLSQISDKELKRLGGLTPTQLLAKISERVIEMMSLAQKVNDDLMDGLEKEDISFVDETELTTGQQEFVRKFFVEKVSPAVFTLILRDKEDVPELRDKSIYLAIKFNLKQSPEEHQYSLIEVPSDLVGRFVELPRYGRQFMMYLEDVIRFNLKYIFFIYDVLHIEAHTVKITRDAELDLDDDVSKGFLEKMSKSVRNRRIGDPVRFVYDKNIPEDVLQFLRDRMDLDDYDSLIPGGRYHNKKDYIKFPNIGERNLQFDELAPMPHPDLDMDRSILNVLSKKDVLLFFPYHSFSYLIRLLREAAIDPDVTHIQVTVYRLANQSRIVSALTNAAKNGKQVTVVIELKARFDEEANIKWTQELQTEGVQVIFGVPGLKVHSKMFLITRMEDGKRRQYASLGTGNFNESSSRFYTDYQLLTGRREITDEVSKVFDFLQKNYRVHKFKHLVVSPHYTRKYFLKRIESEIEFAKKGIAAAITLKLNSLSDTKLIEKLYEASSYGVKIKLIVRGICSLRPGIKGLSDNIEAISILDRFLEHSRVMYFANGGEDLYYISSSDWMPRNLDYRVEVGVPIYDKRIKKQLRDHLEIIWKDNVKSRWQNAEEVNAYRNIKGPRIRSQYALHDYVRKQLKRGW